MDNLTTTRNLCTAIINTFYPDSGVIELMLTNEGIEPSYEAEPKDANLLRIAIRLCYGYAESSRSENGIAVSVDKTKMEKCIKFWLDYYDMDAEAELSSYGREIEDASNRW